MEKYLIVPVTKSPHKRGRIGPERLQDWYRGIVRAVSLQHKLKDSKILVLSDVCISGQEHEADIYERTLKKLGVRNDQMIVLHEGLETIKQIEYIRKMAEAGGYKVILVSTWLHGPRVAWLARGMHTRQYVAFGIPRPREALTDIALTFLFPIIDVFGGRKWFKEKVIGRRKEGKF